MPSNPVEPSKPVCPTCKRPTEYDPEYPARVICTHPQHGTGAEPTHQLRDTTKEIEPTNTDADTQLRRDLIRARYGSNTSGVTVSLAKIIKLEEAARTYADTRVAEARRDTAASALAMISNNDHSKLDGNEWVKIKPSVVTNWYAAQLAPPNYKEK